MYVLVCWYVRVCMGVWVDGYMVVSERVYRCVGEGEKEDEGKDLSSCIVQPFCLCISSLLWKFMTAGRSHCWRPRHFS